MKTVKIFRILLRIIIQAMIPTLFLFMIFDFINIVYKPMFAIVFCTIALFGLWFHFVSDHRFRNRNPRGLYKEYIDWFLNED